MNTTLPAILAAEDEETDRFILKLAFQKAGMRNPVTIVEDGQNVVDYLRGKAPFDDRTTYPLPALLFLDLKMPRMTGFDVLAWLSAQPNLKQIPAIVISSSSHETDRQSALEMGALEYIVKPHEISRFVEVIKGACNRWMAAPQIKMVQ